MSDYFLVRHLGLIWLAAIEVIFAAHVDEETARWIVGIEHQWQHGPIPVSTRMYDVTGGR